MGEEFNGWVTKYALTTGIQKMRLVLGHDKRLARSANASDWALAFWGEGLDWHRTYASAHQRAEKMRKAKLASLAKAVEKLSVPFPEEEP